MACEVTAYPICRAPLAYVCVLDNHHRKTFDLEALEAEVQEGPYHRGVRPRAITAVIRPEAPIGSALVW